MTLTPSEADFIRFWRTAFQGRLPENEGMPGSKTVNLSKKAQGILKKDMASTCLRFLLREGGILSQHRLVQKESGLFDKQEAAFGEETSAAKVHFHFSADWMEFMCHVYHRHPFDPKGRTFHMADGILFTQLLDRLYPTDGSPSLLSRSGYFNEDIIAKLISAMPLPMICFFEKLPENSDADLHVKKTEVPFFLQAISALIPYIKKRWHSMESALWEPEVDPKWIARVSQRRGTISSEIAKICLENERPENLVVFAEFMKETLEKDFYDVERAMARILENLDNAISSTLKEGEYPFSVVYNRPRHYPPEYIPVAHALDALGQSQIIFEWRWANELLAFLFDLPPYFISEDLEGFTSDLGLNENESQLVKKYIQEQLQLYLQEFYFDLYSSLKNQLGSKFRKLPEDKKKEIKEWIIKNVPLEFPGNGDILGRYAYWLISRKSRIELENTALLDLRAFSPGKAGKEPLDPISGLNEIQESLNDEEKKEIKKRLAVFLNKEEAAFSLTRLIKEFDEVVSEWREQRGQEKKIESAFNMLIEDRGDNLYSWVLGLDLETSKECQQVREAILEGFGYAQELLNLRDWVQNMDIDEDKENILAELGKKVLGRISEDPYKVDALFQRYHGLKEAIGYEL